MWPNPGGPPQSGRDPKQVEIELEQRAFSFWSVQHRRWVVEAGAFTIAVGASSRDLPLAETVTIDAPRIAMPLTPDSTLQEWMSDPVGRQLLEDAASQGQSDVVMTGELVSVVGTMPMSTLANFGGMSLDHEALDRAASTWRDRAAHEQWVST
jgi:beta-glucosidase